MHPHGRRLFGEQQGTPRPGTQWGLGAIGAARWTGVPLSTVLRHAGLRDNAVQVMAVGLDDPYVHEGENHGRVRLSAADRQGTRRRADRVGDER